MALAQGELTPLERGFHALRSGMDVKAYAERVGRKRETVRNEVYAAEVCSVAHVGHDGYFKTLVEIHSAPKWLWPALVSAMAAGGWTVETARKRALSVLKRDLSNRVWGHA
jgi:hypothetical protein